MTTGYSYTDSQQIKLKIPSGIIISGPSSSGKTHLLVKLIAQSQDLFDPPPREVLYCFGEFNMQVPHIEKLDRVKVQAGPPTDEQISKLKSPALVILDDLLASIDSRWLNDAFTKKSHHRGYSIVLVTQNLFEKSIKIPRLNAMYIILTRAPNSLLSIRNLGAQLFPHQLPFFLDAYKQATKDKYGYIMLDMHPASDPALKLQTDIFKGEIRKIFLPL
jgi:Adenovirus IVa2 protein